MAEKSKIAYIALISAAVWASLGMQLYLFITWAVEHQLGVMNGIWYYLSYFTNLSNLMAGAALLAALIRVFDVPSSDISTRQITGIAVFICMAGIIFNLELKQFMPSYGLIYIANIMLHDANPLFFLAYWWFYIPHGHLKARDTIAWVAFPVVYFAYILVRGLLTDQYPYPFVNIAKYGYVSVLGNGLQMLAGFLTLGLIFVALDKLKTRRAAKSLAN